MNQSAVSKRTLLLNVSSLQPFVLLASAACKKRVPSIGGITLKGTKPKYSEGNLSQCHFAQHKPHMDWHGWDKRLRGYRSAINHPSHCKIDVTIYKSGLEICRLYVTKTSPLTELIVVCFEINIKHTNQLHGQNAEFILYLVVLNVTTRPYRVLIP